MANKQTPVKYSSCCTEAGSYEWVQHGAPDRSMFVAPPQFGKGQKGRSALPTSKESNCCASLFPQQSTVDKLIKKTNLALVVGTHSWRDQFLEAITVSAGEGEISKPIPASPGHVQPGMRCVWAYEADPAWSDLFSY